MCTGSEDYSPLIMKCYIITFIVCIITININCISANETLTTFTTTTTTTTTTELYSESSREAKSVIEAVPETHYETELFCRGQWKSPQDCIDSKCDYKATWQYIDDNDEIVFTVSTKNRNKWTGIGFSDNQLMPETDAVLGLVEESGRFFLMDSWLRAYEAPPLDQTQNLYNMTAWRENGITTLRFIRKRITGDSKDFQFTDTNCPYLIFPVMGGVFNAVNKRIRKHEVTPVISDRKVCIRSCKQSPAVVTVTASTPESEFKDSDNSIPTKKVLPTTLPPIPPIIRPSIEELYSFELKLVDAWKPTLNQKNSSDYILLQSDLQKQLEIEISKNFDTFKSVNVYQLKSDQNSNNVIAKFNIIVVDDKTIKESNDDSDTDNVLSSLETALNAAISDQKLGNLRVDPNYLKVISYKDESDDEKENEDQIKWIIIFAGIAALICLVLIQAFCMLCRDSKNKETPTSKDKQIPSSHWKDYANARNAYTYENYGTSGDELDAPMKLNGQQSDARSDRQERHQSGNKAQFKNINDKMLNSEKYMSATLERNRDLSNSHSNRITDFGNAYATHDRKDPYYRNYYPSFSQQLQPDFYFMPHQRRYSGEVVKVFVDYNNPQYAPK